MDQLWIAASLAAAVFQALRYAVLKELNQHLSASVTTYIRMLFGLPFLVAYLVGVLWWQSAPFPETTPRFWVLSGLAAMLQFAMTMLVVRMFRHGNFAVGLMITRADVVLTAIIGSVLLIDTISKFGWIAIAITVAGVLTASAGRMSAAAWKSGEARLIDMLFGPATRLGLLSALCAASSYLIIKEAISTLDPAVNALARSALAAAGMTTVSFAVMGVWLLATERKELAKIAHYPGLSLMAGLASAAGTIGWFLATALTNASYVAAVAQIQIVFALLISRYWFRETIRPLEIAGIVLILAGVLVFRIV